MPPEISAKQPTYVRPKKNLLPPFATSLPNMTTPDIRLNACFLYSICPPHLRNELLNERKATGAGVRKRPCVHADRLGQKINIQRIFKQTESWIFKPEDVFSLNQYSYIYSAYHDWLHYTGGKKWEGREAFPVILPKSFYDSETTFLLPKSEGEHLSLTKKHQLHAVFPVEEKDLL